LIARRVKRVNRNQEYKTKMARSSARRAKRPNNPAAPPPASASDEGSGVMYRKFAMDCWSI
jgi:hypothetical protein